MQNVNTEATSREKCSEVISRIPHISGYSTGSQSLASETLPPISAGKNFIKRRRNQRKIYQPRLILGASNTVSGPASIAELARALKNDVDLIYEWVYSNIEFYPIWGSHKSTIGTLLDGYGNSFEQAALMVALLRQAGYTANFVKGTIQLSKTQVENWLGTDDNTVPTSSYDILRAGGIPSSNFLNSSGQLDHVQLDHVWVKVDIGGTNYVFDPSFKTYNYTTGVNIASIVGYNEATLISQAESGATIASDHIQNLNRTNIRNKFKDYGTNLLNWINANRFDANLDDIIGGKKIQQLSSTPVRQTSHPLQASATSTSDFTDIPNADRATYRVWETVSGIDQTFYTDTIYGSRLTVSFNGSMQPELRLNGSLVQAGSAVTYNVYYTLNFTVDHPFAGGGDQTFSHSILAPGIYFLAGNYGPTSQSMVDYHRQQLESNVASGAADSSESVVGESLAILWFSHLSQSTQVTNIEDWLVGTTHSLLNICGIAGRNAYYQGPYFDIQGVNYGVTSRSGDTSTAQNAGLVSDMFLNGFEAGVMQQRFPVTGINTQRMLDTANTEGQEIFDTTSANWTTGSSIRNQLVNFPSNILTAMDNLISLGARLIVHKNGATAVGSFTGGGWHIITGTGLGGALFGNVLGGAASAPVPDQQIKDKTKNTPEKDKTKDKDKNKPPTSEDPIVLSNGNFVYDRTDLTVGSGGFPYSLDFARSYTSGGRYADSVLGKGWSHNYQSSIAVQSNGQRGLGEVSPKEAAATIAQVYVLVQLGLYNATTPPSLTKVLIASLGNIWLMDQLTNNAVAVSALGQTKSFIKLVDDTYLAAPGYADTLIKNIDGTYTLKNPQQKTWNFNAAGNVATYVDPAGVTVTATYDGSNRVSAVSNGLGRTLTFTYSGSRLASVSDGNGRSVSFTIDSNGNLVTFTDPLSHNITYQYALPGQISKIFRAENPSVAVVENTYDTLGRVMTQKGADTDTYNYFFAGSRSEEVDPLGNRHITYYNSRGLLLKETNALGHTWTYDFDGISRLVKTTMPEGNSVVMTYDHKNNVLTRTMKAKPGSPLADIVNSFTYHSTWNKMLTATDGRSNTTTFTLDAATGNLLTIQRPQVAGQTPTVTFTYNSRGQILTITEETGIVTKNTFDTSTENLLSTVVDFGTSPHLNLTTSFGYNPWGDVTSVTDPRGNTTNFTFDNGRKMTQRVAASPFGFITNFAWDSNDRLTSAQRQTGNVSNPWQIFASAYTVSGKLDSRTDPASNVTDYVFDTLNRLQKIVDPENRSVELTYDQLNRVSTAKDPALQTSVTNNFTPNSRTASVKDTRNNMTIFQYDGFDRLEKTTYPDSTFEEKTFDANGNVVTFRTRAGQVITMTFDVLNRLSTKTPASMPTQTSTYDLAGRLTKISTPVVSGEPTSGDFEFFFDTAGRLIQQKKPDGKIVSYDLDANSNKTKLTYPDGYFVDYVFDELNRMTHIKLNGSSAAAAHFDYNALSNRTKLTFNNGCSVDYGYEVDDDMSSMAHAFVGSSVSFAYSFDKIHQVKDLTVNDSRFMWNPLTDLTTTYAAANNLNQYPTVGGAGLSYDGNGCLTGDGTWTYGFDTLSRLTSATAGVSASFLYDPMDRQGEKNIGGVKTRFLYDGIQRIADYDGTGNLLNRFVFGNSLDEPLIQVASGGTLTYFHYDRQKSLIATTDASGAIIGRFGYGPFGETTSLSGVPIGYTGQRYDAETGLYFYKSRYYSPKLGRFLQPDLIGYSGGLHLYTYVGNSPVTLHDPLGLSPIRLGAAPEPKAKISTDGSVASTFGMLSPPSVGSTDSGATTGSWTGLDIFIPNGDGGGSKEGGGSGSGGGGGGGFSPWLIPGGENDPLFADTAAENRSKYVKDYGSATEGKTLIAGDWFGGMVELYNSTIKPNADLIPAAGEQLIQWYLLDPMKKFIKDNGLDLNTRGTDTHYFGPPDPSRDLPYKEWWPYGKSPAENTTRFPIYA